MKIFCLEMKLFPHNFVNNVELDNYETVKDYKIYHESRERFA